MFVIKFKGGLGNQMFQYAFYKTLLELDEKTFGDFNFFHRNIAHNGYELGEVFPKININQVRKLDLIRFNRFLLRLDIFSKKRVKIFTQFTNKYQNICIDANNIYFDGYWQSEKYFRNIKDKLLIDFTFKPIINPKMHEILEDIITSNSISVHIRRGDYVNLEIYNNICTYDYYESAIKVVSQYIRHPKFFVFSDDIDWCKGNIGLPPDSVYVNNSIKEESYIDMQLMSQCKCNIIANSTFSWWGAYLNTNKGKIVIAPSKILNIEDDNIDLILDEWIKIDSKGKII